LSAADSPNAPSRVRYARRQIVGWAISDDAEGVEVGVIVAFRFRDRRLPPMRTLSAPPPHRRVSVPVVRIAWGDADLPVSAQGRVGFRHGRRGLLLHFGTASGASGHGWHGDGASRRCRSARGPRSNGSFGACARTSPGSARARRGTGSSALRPRWGVRRTAQWALMGGGRSWLLVR